MPRVPKPVRQDMAVLVVDDDRDGADTTALVLRLYGFEAWAVYSADHAETEVLTRRVDVVVTDVLMPGADGCELAERLTGLPQPPMLIAVTGDARTVEQCLAAGFDHVFLKPVNPDELVAALTSHAARHCRSGSSS